MISFLDCTPRDGGYYNSWDFPQEVMNDYLISMQAAGVNVVEMGMRSLKNDCFNGACAYTTDDYLRNLIIPSEITVGVMVNASEIVGELALVDAMGKMFPEPASSSPVSLVRIACHVHEFSKALPASEWLKKQGYGVGFNLMQVADRSQEEIEALAAEASAWPLDVLYFADSMGSMNPEQTCRIIRWLRTHWKGQLGIHTHDNMGMALQNTLRALENGVTWVDSTVTGMGRGPGNARTEELAIELADIRGRKANFIPLLSLIRRYFSPLQQQYGWGTNPYYYLAGKYGIHPTYIQEMLSDSRYNEEDILAVIEHLRLEGGKKFSLDTLDAARHFYQGEPRGTWNPELLIGGREVLLLGTGPGVANYRAAIESYVRNKRPFVLALNTQSHIAPKLIDARIACHPTRLLADCEEHTKLPQPLITPAGMLPEEIRKALQGKTLLDFGIGVKSGAFSFEKTHCILPTSLVFAYALAVTTSGRANNILLAGFDGYGAGDPRNQEMNRLLDLYRQSSGSLPVVAITPTRYDVKSKSIYGM
ncbi:aldolase catalytic domain-containing protein [Desulfurispirillum indicum]|uniref:aldolase catalytic domain-containing protein n=1 Tax=Desulfurispirillum indicum TaxID=936456 RepID=UPI001CFC1F3F|nr:aldolase catalytic domain-containing protein [Desulfurispirillum indicum]UCZ56941.1 aldolase catalytic domain-containing protein [Desulfurispirillum indicum]